MDLMQLISLLLQTQNRRLIQPELGRNERNYNQTPGNPPVTLDPSDGFLRALIPWETGEGPPGGMFNDDGRPRSLEELLMNSPRYENYMDVYRKQGNQFEYDVKKRQSADELNRSIIDNMKAMDRDSYLKRRML